MKLSCVTGGQMVTPLKSPIKKKDKSKKKPRKKKETSTIVNNNLNANWIGKMIKDKNEADTLNYAMKHGNLTEGDNTIDFIKEINSSQLSQCNSVAIRLKNEIEQREKSYYFLTLMKFIVVPQLSKCVKL